MRRRGLKGHWQGWELTKSRRRGNRFRVLVEIWKPGMRICREWVRFYERHPWYVWNIQWALLWSSRYVEVIRIWRQTLFFARIHCIPPLWKARCSSPDCFCSRIYSPILSSRLDKKRSTPTSARIYPPPRFLPSILDSHWLHLTKICYIYQEISLILPRFINRTKVVDSLHHQIKLPPFFVVKQPRRSSLRFNFRVG